jgi:hypothetical protein
MRTFSGQRMSRAASSSREDHDFGELVIRQRLGVRGMILPAPDRLSNAMEADVVADVVSIHADKLLGNLVVIEPGRIRVRPLPR